MRETGGRTRREIINMPWTHNERPREAVCLFSDGSSSTPGMSAVSLFCPGLLDLPLLPLSLFILNAHETLLRSSLFLSLSLLPRRNTVLSCLFLPVTSPLCLKKRKERKKERNEISNYVPHNKKRHDCFEKRNVHTVVHSREYFASN